MKTRLITTVSVAVLICAAGCSSGGSGGSFTPVGGCGVEGQKQFVFDGMNDIYFWNTQMPVVDPANFATPEELLDAMLFKPIDRFSRIGSAQADLALFSAGEIVAFGFGSILLANDDLRVTQVFAGSSAEQEGLQRNYRILLIDGRTIADIVANEGISAAFGPRDVGLQRTLRIEDLGGIQSDVTLTKSLITLDPVPVSNIFDVGGTPVGYLLFNTFVDPSIAALDAVFVNLRNQGVRNVIVDMRYNGGGLVAVAEYLGDLLGGLTANAQVFSQTVYNANNAFRNSTTTLAARVNSITIDRVIFVTTGSTASASELVINGLEPHIDVVLVGDTTFGKPVGQLGFEFCSKIFWPISFQTLNADSFGDFFNGLPVDCQAADDLGFVLGDPMEGSLAEALFYAGNGTCSPVPQAQQQKTADVRALNRLETEKVDYVGQITGVN